MADFGNHLDYEWVSKGLYDHYGIKGQIVFLYGEVDLNFKITASDHSIYIAKISPPGYKETYLDFQNKILLHLGQNKDITTTPQPIENNNKAYTTFIQDPKGTSHALRLLTWIEGRLWSAVNPITDPLRFQLGVRCGEITKALESFTHKEAHRFFKWDTAQILWVEEYLHCFSSKERELVEPFLLRYKNCAAAYGSLRKQVVHNDANDNNIIVSTEQYPYSVSGIIDFGDAIYTQLIHDVAHCCAYAIMNVNQPLSAAIQIVKGYHSQFPLQEKELEHLYLAIALRLVNSVTHATISKKEHPENEYLLISESAAWNLLRKWQSLSEEEVHYQFRNACGFKPHPNHRNFVRWAKRQKRSLAELFPKTEKNDAYTLDLSVSSKELGMLLDFDDLDAFQFKLKEIQKNNPKAVLLGGYLEPRPFYTSSAYERKGNSGKEWRTIHLGVDYWLPEETPIQALYEGKVVVAANERGHKTYGGLIILQHNEEGIEFFTLYGHLSKASIESITVGEKIEKGARFASLGTPEENGNWVPHLHFQVLLSLLDFKDDFIGVAYPSEMDTWKSICPNPNLLFQRKGSDAQTEKGEGQNLFKERKQILGKGMSLQYDTPIHMVRGNGVYLMDSKGQNYLDTVNNVAHVGHEHPKVVRAGQTQMGILNTNTRYLHETITALAKALVATLPQELNVVHFVNSGSEANELAIRMVKTVSGSPHMIVSEVGYHGNTNACVDVSSYKFDGKGGSGAPKTTHVFPLPDSFRGKYRGENSATLYLEEVKKCIQKSKAQGVQLGGCIVESIISCGGQIELPDGFLKGVYKAVRAAGGLCIADEVQTGLGRVGSAFWGFELHGVVPDIVTIGKPFGNGHPVAAVVCKEEVAEKFANGMEYFNTFGGNPVSCAIAKSVLEVIEEEELQKNALIVGTAFKNELQELSQHHPIVGSIRGQGLFLGIELVDQELNPLASQASYLVNRMKQNGVLMSTDGPDHNVIKIKPPLTFSLANVEEVLYHLNSILNEDYMKIS